MVRWGGHCAVLAPKLSESARVAVARIKGERASFDRTLERQRVILVPTAGVDLCCLTPCFTLPGGMEHA